MTGIIKYPIKPKHMCLERFPTLRSNWEYSHNKLSKINRYLSENLSISDISIVVAGSYGRMEASPISDLDFIVLCNEKITEADKAAVLTSIQEITSSHQIQLPNPTGVFSESISVRDMVENLGDPRKDSLMSLAQRMLLLMESRAIYNEDLFKEATDRILKTYLEFVIDDPKKEALVLLNDLIRYFRSICVNYQFSFWNEHEKWGLRNVKLRHSRVILYAGLLFIILNVSKNRDDKYSYLFEKTFLTPLEKIGFVYEDNQCFSFEKILGPYEIFLRKITTPDIRDGLRIEYDERYHNPDYLELRVTSASLQTELVRFINSMKGIWTDKVLEYLIF